MANNKKYFTVFNNGVEDLYVKDEEAQSSIASLMQVQSVSLSTDLSDQTCPFTLSAGEQGTVIYTNSGSTARTVTISTTYSTPDGQQISLTVPVGGYAEVSYLKIGSTIYARGV